MSRIRCLLLLEKCKNMRHMKQIHAQIVMGGFGEDSFALSRIMAFCSDPNKGSLNYASLLFEGIDHPTICIRNTMIKASLHHGEDYTKPIEIYCQLLRDGLCPDDYTLPYVLKACANLQDPQIGEQVHTHVLKIGFGSNIFVGNTLILMYSVCGDMNSAREVFDGMPHRTEVAWTVVINGYSMQGEVEEARVMFDKAPEKDWGIWGSMISGYMRNNCFKEVLMMFRLMQLVGLEPDEAVFVCVLSACGQVGAKDIGTWIHHYLNRIGLRLGVRLGTALMDMYAKCGELHSARKIFDGLLHRDTVCWNVMILGLAIHGDGLGAMELFSRMKKEGFRPDDATFIAIFAACQHSGMVVEGLRMFNSMKVVHGIEPKSDHYGCIVDVLSRSGLFEEAIEIVGRIPNSSSSTERGIAWRALLSACAIHGETKLAEIAAEKLLQIEDHSGVYVLLSNVYLTDGKYGDATRMRRTMKGRGVGKVPGCSSIELGGSVHEFVAGEEMHPQMGEIYMLLETMNDLLASASYNFKSDYI